jgi:hypothetical protein
MRAGITAVLLTGALAAACSGGSTSGSGSASQGDTRTPVAATSTWFAAINAKDQSAVLALMTSTNGAEGAWRESPSGWPTFTNLRCHALSEATNTATVECTFQESAATGAGNPDSFWDVELVKQPSGGWLVDNYGQG